MHLPDNLVSLEINAGAATASVLAVGAALWRGSKTLTERQVPLLGSTAAFIFAAQMLNFPVGAGVSGHFLGATLAAMLLGPLNACLIMAVVLIIQCLGFVDGGVTALGSNIFNMGIVGGFVGYGLLAAFSKMLPRKRAVFIGVTFVAAWASVMVASAVCALELVFSGRSAMENILPPMLAFHAVIGLGEGVITCAMASMLLAVRPDLVQAWNTPREHLAGSVA
ncbi:MAG: energy-coupling factor ABC transporter permease [Planctomycetes bacterium]|nr:energy-coupling factor ABC transporter permease [Planctomycetota bacterium]